ncbi:hypothetical protein K470107D9_09880 [Sutterella wadsworthensis]
MERRPGKRDENGVKRAERQTHRDVRSDAKINGLASEKSRPKLLTHFRADRLDGFLRERWDRFELTGCSDPMFCRYNLQGSDGYV